MHNLAIAMHKKGFDVTGSDDEVFEPSKSRLDKLGLLPDEMGWHPEKLSGEIDAVILGMHARSDNPELLRAQELGLKIYSYPEYIYEQTKDKTRVVIGGSHGKTSITAMILHVLNECGVESDYMVGALLEGFDTMVRLTKTAKVAVIEGDEYLSSPIDRRPKFHLYHPDVALLSGIAWDHINVFPTFDNYVEQFRIYVDLIEPNGSLVYCTEDAEVVKVAERAREDVKRLPYGVPEHVIRDGITYLKTEEGEVPLIVFGVHNLLNINGARLVCNQIGVNDKDFYQAISTFKGASNRLELLGKNTQTAVYKDFAHSPSKLKATTSAVKEQFPERDLVACMELHTFSSLNEEFLGHYKGAMAKADKAYVYYSPHTIAHKKLKPITPAQVKDAFGTDNVEVYTDSKELHEKLLQTDWHDKTLLMMSSGNFDGIDVKQLAQDILE